MHELKGRACGAGPGGGAVVCRQGSGVKKRQERDKIKGGGGLRREEGKEGGDGEKDKEEKKMKG